MIYLWASGIVFLCVILILLLLSLAELVGTQLSRLFEKKDLKARPLFNISIIQSAFVLLIQGFLFTSVMAAANQARDSANEEILFPAFTSCNPENQWPLWANLGFPLLIGLVAALMSTTLLMLIRHMLSEESKSYITWRKSDE